MENINPDLSELIYEFRKTLEQAVSALSIREIYFIRGALISMEKTLADELLFRMQENAKSKN